MAARVGMQPPVFAAGSAAVKLGHREMKFRAMTRSVESHCFSILASIMPVESKIFFNSFTYIHYDMRQVKTSDVYRYIMIHRYT